MNRHVNAISGRLSLRPPQRRSLEILDRLTEIVPPKKNVDVTAILETIRSEFSTVTDFEREFPSLCFALATGVGKTRLMGAFISYLHLAHGINNFFVMAPNLTIYNKLITDFTPNTSKYVFKGIAEFVTDSPEIITGDNYESRAGTLFDQVLRCKVNIFNISKINSEVRGGKSPRIRKLSEYIGESYFDYLAGLPDLVLIMDESHRYRASAGVRAINELKPILGLELTATPYVETNKGPLPFKNVIYDYRLGRAIEDGFVKEPAVVTRKDFNPKDMSPEAIEQMKLEDGVRLHENVKVELEIYARETGQPIVKPFILVIARDTTHAGKLLELIQSASFFDGAYKDKVIQVDSSMTGSAEDEMIERLLKVEQADEPTEIVIHVNMLKEGWDVTNLYTIVPLRAANARILIEQSIGRGLRLPYGRRTGVTAVDRLNIVAHDKFQEIVEEANKPDSLIRLKTVEIQPGQLERKPVTVVSQSILDTQLGIRPENLTPSTIVAGGNAPSLFTDPEEQKVAQIVRQMIQKRENRPQEVPSIAYLHDPKIQESLVRETEEQYRPAQLEMGSIVKTPDIAKIVQKTVELVDQGTIQIPRILVLPKGEVKSGFKPFELNLSSLRYPPVSEDLWIQHLRTHDREVLSLGKSGIQEERLEDFIVSGLVDFDDVDYDKNSDLLYDLATQCLLHFKGYLSEENLPKILRCHQKDIARLVHAQMQEHYWEDDKVEYEVKVSKGFTELMPCHYGAVGGESPLNFRQSPTDKSNMAKYRFTGFNRCLYPELKFQSDSERKMAVILDRDSLKWFKPVKGQFQIFYRIAGNHRDYQPDFVVESEKQIDLIETKARNEMESDEVKAKKNAAVLWCQRATDHAKTCKGKPWKYSLIPHDEISENQTLNALTNRFAST